MHNNITKARQINNNKQQHYDENNLVQVLLPPSPPKKKKRKKKKNKTKQILSAFETDINKKLYIMTVTCCFCLVYMIDSLQS